MNNISNFDELNDMNIKITYLEEQIEKAMKTIHLMEESIKICASADLVK